MLPGVILFCGIFFAAVGCQPVKRGTAVKEPTVFETRMKSNLPTSSDTFSSPRIESPPGATVIVSITEPIFTPTPAACSPGGSLSVNGKLIFLPALPASASIQNIRGQTQSLPLDCESRSAMDWAGYFGVKISKLEFLNKLPVSDDPNIGFVGNVRGRWGNLPPNAYRVYAGPVAKLLRSYAYRPSATAG
jgi:hypothetical protein